MKKIGIVGPSNQEKNSLLSEALSFLLYEADADLVIYFGTERELENAVSDIAATVFKSSDPEEEFLQEVLKSATNRNVLSAVNLAKQDQQLRQLANIRTLPSPDTQLIELLESHIVLLVQDAKSLDNDDKRNANLVISNTQKKPTLTFKEHTHYLCTGELSFGEIAIIKSISSGIELDTYDPQGTPLRRQSLEINTATMKIAH